MDFEQMALSEPILHALRKAGYHNPMPIQHDTIPPALEGRDILGCAETGTGKTCAFAIPILQHIAGRTNGPERPIRALVLTPTRELAMQVHESFRAYGRFLYFRTTAIFGGVNQRPQVQRLTRGVDILVATPGRLLDLYRQGFVDFSHVETFVLDEADRMLDMGFIDDVMEIVRLLPPQRQTLLFSATMPAEIRQLAGSLLHHPVQVTAEQTVPPLDLIQQSVYYVDSENKSNLLAHLIRENRITSVLVFSRTKHGANQLVRSLTGWGIPSAALHGSKSQATRREALSEFKSGFVTALVATDIAARGIDIDHLDWVVNYDLPEVPETYIHRIGRTGRAGRGGTALSFCCGNERDLLRHIEKTLGRKLPVIEDHPFPIDADEEEFAEDDVQDYRSYLYTYANDPDRKSRGNVRQGDLSATLPDNPSMPATDFVKPNPLDSDIIMDATARLLAPKPRMRSPRPSPLHSSESPGRTTHSQSQANSNQQNHQGRRKFPTKKTPSVPELLAAGLGPTREHSDSSWSMPKKTAPAYPRKERKHTQTPNRSWPSYDSHQKDSTEQSESVIKPYYLSDD